MAEKYATIYTVKGVEGDSIYINDFRVAGPKPWGGGQYINQWKRVAVKDILNALDENRLPLKAKDEQI